MIVMEGTLADLDLASLAVVTSLGRTSLRLEVTEPSGAPVGKLVLKAGRVVSATGGGVRGRDALQVIMSAAADSLFRLVREPLDYELSSALALVEELAELGRPRLAKSSSEQLELVEPPPIRPSSDPSARVRMMEGRLDEFDLATVLHTIGVGRSCVELDVRDESRALIGTLRVKAGQVVSAQARRVEGMAAFSALLTAPDCHNFVAFRIDADLADVEALGSVTQLLLGAVAPAAAPVTVMEGALAEFDVATLLQTVACGRQHCTLELYDDAQVAGSLELKSSQVLSANAGALTGRAAIRQLVGLGAPYRFRLKRLSGPLGDHVPIGSIDQLLLQLGPSREAIEPPPIVARPDGDDRVGRAIVPELMPVMAGSLEDFAFRTLLETLAFTRQYSQLQILGRDGKPLGELRLKSGMIVSARAGAREGAEALAFLLEVSSDCQFRMVAGAFDVSGPPLGSIREMLAVAAATSAQRRSQRASRLLRAAIPLSFLLGGAVVFVVTRGTRPGGSGASNDPVVQMEVRPAKPAPAVEPAPAAAQLPAAQPAAVAPPAVEPPAVEPPAVQPAAVAPPAAQPPAVPEPAGAAVEPPAAPIVQAAPPPSHPSAKPSISAAQAALKQLGFDPGPIDNVLGDRTRRALRRFQHKLSLRETGLVDDPTWVAIVAQLTGN